ncbi:hypothetical protein R1sor_022717 [Riccia sorocarpa]|uniref:MIP18 family-like domain-containing protein n=1 Tax=Riccia sorocarpa TaxID=122646 RepID=A0ABD3GM69_9MARC
MTPGLINANPVVHETKARSARTENTDENSVDEFDVLEIFDILFQVSICVTWLVLFVEKDPEHPYTLEQLNVVSEDAIDLDNKASHVTVTFTPTVQHCSMATVIGLCIRVKLMRCLPPRFKVSPSPVFQLFFKVDIRVAPGSHASEAAVNKQLSDKERVAAALENPHLVEMVERCLQERDE